MHGIGVDGPLRAFLVHDNSNDLDIIWRIEVFQYFFRVCHLRHRLRRNKRHSINVLESHADQGTEVVCLDRGRNLALQPLPGIARTLDEFDGIGHKPEIEPWRN